MKTQIKKAIITLTCAAALFSVATVKASNFDFHVDINTASLTGAFYSPFFLDFQLNQGSGSFTTVANISNFSFADGSSTGSPSYFGLASGGLGSSVTLNCSKFSAFNEFYQGFSVGTTDIQFDVSLSQAAAGLTPTEFAVAILDSESVVLPQISTTAPDRVSLLVLGVGDANNLADIGTYTSTSPEGVTVAASAVPEPATGVIFSFGLVGMLASRRQRRE